MKRSGKTKVLFILPTLGSGGAERVLITLMNNLNRDRFEPLFLALNEEGPAREWIMDGIPFYSFGNRSVKGSVFKLIEFIKAHRPDTVVTTMVHSNALVLLMKIVFPQTRVIVRESSMPQALINEYGWKGKACKCIYKFLYPKADLVISPSQLIPRQFRDILKQDIANHAVLYNPVDTGRIYAGVPKEFDVNERMSRTHFVFLGRLGVEKGLDRLFQALAENKLKNGWRLDIIGEGAIKEALQKQVKELGLEDQVFFKGFCQNPWTSLAQADCLLLPSRWEGMPNVVLEALACGVQVIAHEEAGAIREIQELSKPGDVQVAHTMSEFVDFMAGVKPYAKEKMGASRLPADFSLSKIMENFEARLTA